MAQLDSAVKPAPKKLVKKSNPKQPAGKVANSHLELIERRRRTRRHGRVARRRVRGAARRAAARRARLAARRAAYSPTC